MKKYKENMKKYKENMKKYERILKKNEGITLPVYGLRDLEKFQAVPLIYGPGGGGGAQNTNLGRVGERTDMKHVNLRPLFVTLHTPFMFLTVRGAKVRIP